VKAPLKLESWTKVPSALMADVKADPWHAPEHIALAAAEYHGPAAAAWYKERRERYSYGGHELARMATTKHAGMARLTGAAWGLGGFATIVPDMATLAWIQSRLVFYIAAAYEFDPMGPMRPAELLVLRDLYPDPAAARKGLDKEGPGIAAVVFDKTKTASADQQAAVQRLTRMVGGKGAERIAQRAIPGFASMFNAYGNEKETRRLADKAMKFYGG
jgi:hypothetical protein